MEITATIRSGLRTAGSCIIPTLAALVGDGRRANRPVNRPVNRVTVEQSYPSVQRFENRAMSIVSSSGSNNPEEEVRSKPELSDRVISEHVHMTRVKSEGYDWDVVNSNTTDNYFKFLDKVILAGESTSVAGVIDPRNDSNFDYIIAKQFPNHNAIEEVKSKPESKENPMIPKRLSAFIVHSTDPVKKDGFGDYLGVPCLPHKVDPRSDRKYDYLLANLAPKVPTTDL